MSSVVTTKVWELLPGAAKNEISYPAKFEEGALEEISAHSAMPIKMVKVLFRKLSRDNNVPAAVRQGLDYFLYFIDEKAGIGRDSQKMDFLTYYLIVVEGLVHWPLEITMALQKLAEQHAMYKIVEKVNTTLIRTQLDSKQKEDGVTRKPVNNDDLQKCVDFVLRSSSGTGKMEVKKTIGKSDLALDPFSAWTGSHWNSALRMLRFSTPEEFKEMEEKLLTILSISKEGHKELAAELKPLGRLLSAPGV